MKVFVYEHITASISFQPNQAESSLYREGMIMRDTLVGLIQQLGYTVRIAYHSEDFLTACQWADLTLVIAPETDGILGNFCETARQHCPILLNCGATAISLSTDKWAMYQHWLHQQVPTPRTWLGSQWQPQPGTFIHKPRDGAGSQDTFLVGTEQEKQFTSADLIQEFHPGVPASVTFLAGPSGKFALLAGKQLIEPETFAYLGGEMPLGGKLGERATKIAQRAIESVPGLLGLIGVDVILGEDGEDVVIEINPRLTTSIVGLAALSETNLFAQILAVARGQDTQFSWKSQKLRFSPTGKCEFFI
ncbi:MAG: ATP-grasp domain-containing protein [Zavarzinella sp.]